MSLSDLEISKALALAIGWPEDDVEPCGESIEVWVHAEPNPFGWKPFDYRDWNVIGPIAEKFDCFPKFINGMWEIAHSGDVYRAYIPQKAIALAVIGAKK